MMKAFQYDGSYDGFLKMCETLGLKFILTNRYKYKDVIIEYSNEIPTITYKNGERWEILKDDWLIVGTTYGVNICTDEFFKKCFTHKGKPWKKIKWKK